MKWNITDVIITSDDTVNVRFQDGTEGSVTFTPDFFRGVFSHLRDPQLFRQIRLMDGTITWPGELDLAPDALYQRIHRDGRHIQLS